MSSSLQNKESDFNKLKKIASTLSISLAFFLSIIKIIATYYTGSLAILSSMVDSLSDVLASAITFVAIRYSTKPATRSFRYGYGKAEALSSFLQSLFITASGIFILFDAVRRFFNPQTISEGFLGLLVMSISLVLTISLVCFQRYVVRKTNSLALKGDSAHYIVDIATNLSVIFTLILIKLTNIYWFDSLIAVGIAIYLIYNAYKLAKEAIFTLMDQELDKDIRDNIEKIILSQPFTKGVHDLRTRSLGGNYIFEFHLELDPHLSLVQAHNNAHKVEDEIKKVYPNSQVVIHQEPKGANEIHLDMTLN